VDSEHLRPVPEIHLLPSYLTYRVRATVWTGSELVLPCSSKKRNCRAMTRPICSPCRICTRMLFFAANAHIPMDWIMSTSTVRSCVCSMGNEATNVRPKRCGLWGSRVARPTTYRITGDAYGTKSQSKKQALRIFSAARIDPSRYLCGGTGPRLNESN
jgi:hypothetical protein